MKPCLYDGGLFTLAIQIRLSFGGRITGEPLILTPPSADFHGIMGVINVDDAVDHCGKSFACGREMDIASTIEKGPVRHP